MSVDEKVWVTPDEAIKRLKVIEDYDQGDGPKPHVHTFATGTGMLLGAHWSVEQARVAFETYGVEEAGPNMEAMGHGLVIVRPSTGPVFFETLHPAERPATLEG